MALFKVCRGNENNLPVAKNDGWAYFCTDTGNFYIDWDGNDGISRVQINADNANRLRYLDANGEYIDIPAKTIAESIASLGKKSVCYFSRTQPAEMTTKDLWVEIIE